MSLKYVRFFAFLTGVLLVFTAVECEREEAPDLDVELDLHVEPCFSYEQNGADFRFDSRCSGENVKRVWWEFGEHLAATSNRNPSYTYRAPGAFTVKLTVVNHNNEEFEISKEVQVEEFCFHCICKSRFMVDDMEKKGCGTMQQAAKEEKEFRDLCNRISAVHPARCL